MNSLYGDAQRELQDTFQSRALADKLEQIIVHNELNEMEKAFIETQDMFFLSTVSDSGWPTVSYKGGAAGFVRVLDPKTIVFPSYDGNGMFLSTGNISATAKIGMLFIDFERPHRLRVQASAHISKDDGLLASYPGAQLVLRAGIEQVFVNCPRYIHRCEKVQASKYVPDGDGKAPMPGWKRIDLIQDALPPRDQGRAEFEGGILNVEGYQASVAKGDV